MLSGKSDLPGDPRARAPDGLTYFECTIVNEGCHGSISVGLVADDGREAIKCHPGGAPGSLGWYGRDGNFYNSRMPAGPRFGKAGDTVGVGYSPSTRSVFFTLNGKELPPIYGPEWFKEQESLPDVNFASVRACVAMSQGTKVHMNFGSEPFRLARLEA